MDIIFYQNEYKAKEPPPLVIVEEFYDKEELELIWRELNFLTSKDKLLDPSETKSAIREDKTFKKNNRAIFLDVAYNDRRISDILKVNRKIFNEDFMEKLIDINPIFRSLKYSNHDNTLISYYENRGKYEPHADEAILTILTYFFKEPKQFSGGNLLLNDYNLEIEIKNNMVVIFPSALLHEVTEVKMENSNFDGAGRYCMSQFIATLPR